MCPALSPQRDRCRDSHFFSLNSQKQHGSVSCFSRSPIQGLAGFWVLEGIMVLTGGGGWQQVFPLFGIPYFGISLWAAVGHNLEQNKNRTVKNVENR